MIVPFLKTGYNRDSEQYWQNCDHFKFSPISFVMAGLDLNLRDLYLFDGSHPAKWLAQMEKCFRLNYIMDDQTQLSVGIMYLDNERLQWWQGHQRCYRRPLTWDKFTKTLMDHFDCKSKLVDKLTKTDTQPSKDFIFTGKKETKEPKGLFSAGIYLL